MDKLKRLLKKTPPVPLGIAGALLFLLLFYTLAFRTPAVACVDAAQYR